KDGDATEDGVGGVPCDLALGGLTDQALRISESDVRGGVRLPCSLAMISTRSCCDTPAQE
ncbi:hypothetical protein A2U01_0090973, partial [Trifolium medium]|nr:hypothetical protein [Trifolium medium]